MNLKWKNIDFSNRFLYIERSKSGKPMTIPLCNAAIEALASVKRHPESPYVFCNKEGKKFFNVRKGFYNALRKAGA